MRRIFLALLLCSFALAQPSAALAQIVYDNFTTDLGIFLDQKTLENGDQITLAPGTGRTVTDFTFEYWITPASFQGTETVDIRFYKLDGGPISSKDPTPTPGTKIYD